MTVAIISQFAVSLMSVARLPALAQLNFEHIVNGFALA